jgi:hypothetical protein
MRASLSLSLALSALVLAGPSPADGQAPLPARDDPAVCVARQTEARYGALGYDHLVSLANGCTRAVECQVSTNVAPTPISRVLAPRESALVLTFRGSPARSFTARIDCRLR